MAYFGEVFFDVLSESEVVSGETSRGLKNDLDFFLGGFSWFFVDLFDRSSRGFSEDLFEVISGFVGGFDGFIIIVFEDFGDVLFEELVLSDPFGDGALVFVFSASGGND